MGDRVPLDFDPPVRQLRALLLGITNDDLRSPTPCDGWTVGDLLDHIVDFTRAYTQAAQKLTDAPGSRGVAEGALASSEVLRRPRPDPATVIAAAPRKRRRR